MKIVILCLLLVSCAFAQDTEVCTSEVCQPPDCRCFDSVLDENIPIANTPQLVMLTFDDAVTAQIYDLVQPIFEDIENPDGCPAAATWFVSHEYTDYSKVHALWADGHEIALHSISHSPYTNYWANISPEELIQEFGEQKQLMSHFANINADDIKGIRVPLFQLSGNQTFETIKELGLEYDSSWPTRNTNPGKWPYSLDFLSSQDCPIGVCPTASLPGVWVMPLMNWEDTEGVVCAMVDACRTIPDTQPELVEWLISNFNRIYKSNRAPFGVYIHAAWFLKNETNLLAYKEFVQYMNSMDDVYFVSSSRALEYTRNPRAIGEIGSPTTTTVEPTPTTTVAPTDAPTDEPASFRRSFAGNIEITDECNAQFTPDCVSRLCELTREDINEQRWMTSCAECPRAYPWKNNPLGE